MAIPTNLVGELQQLKRSTSKWFSIEEIKKRDGELEIAARYIWKTTNEEQIIRRSARDLYKRLENWAARLLEAEALHFEKKLWETCTENSYVPSAEDTLIMRDELISYVTASAESLKSEIAAFSGFKPEKYEEEWFALSRKLKSIAQEISVTVPLAGEITRLESIESGYAPIDVLGYAEIRIERFLRSSYSKIPHPFDPVKALSIPASDLTKAIRLLTFVIFKNVHEPRLTGVERRFVSVFTRYLSCSREACSAVVDQVISLYEPFLKKLAFLFNIKNDTGGPIWGTGLSDLIPGLNISTANLKEDADSYWQTQPVEDAVLRVAFQLRNKGAHEAHEHPYFEYERHAYFVFAAMIISVRAVIASNHGVAKTVEHQSEVDRLRDLFVKIEELGEGPHGPRNTTRLERLQVLAGRAHAIWPNCSSALCELLESEYLSVKTELNEADAQDEIEAYLEGMAEDYYS